MLTVTRIVYRIVPCLGSRLRLFSESYPLNSPPSQVVQWWLRRFVAKVFVWIVWPLVFPRHQRLPRHPFPTDAPIVFLNRNTQMDLGVQGQDGRNRWLDDWGFRRRVVRYVPWLVLLFAIIRAQMALYSEDSRSSRTVVTPT